VDIPPLAGVSTYEAAAHVGLGVDETVDRLVRYAWIARRTMDVALYWLNPTPEWEVKEALSLHAYLAADHAQDFRDRVSEMRNPPPNMNLSPDTRLDAFFDELLTAETTCEKITGLYGVLKPALLAAYHAHYEAANPLVDFPTRRILRHLMLEEGDAVTWGEAATQAMTCSRETLVAAEAFKDHLQAYLDAAGGIDGTADFSGGLPPSRGEVKPDFFPRRDERFINQWNFVFPPHEVCRTEGVPADEKTLALMCKRTLEMDVPEAMARMIAEAKGQPWKFYVDMCRQLWDEARHAMMGSVYFEKLGVNWREDIPLHPGFAIRLNHYLNPVEAHAVLYTIEQSLMPATTGKKYEWLTADEANDPLAKLYQDFDWADEVLHVNIGREWGLATSGMNRQQFQELGHAKAVESESVLDAFNDRAEQVNWWPDFVRKVLGKESAVVDAAFNTSDPVYRKKVLNDTNTRE
jgi:hypothetical protein